MSIAPQLEYYPDSRPGITRKRHGKGFTYIAPDGTRIDNRSERERLSGLGVPPAWEDVWMCPLDKGHLQATGRDVKARKQYRYHPDWSSFRSERKFAHLVRFGEKLPGLRRRILRDLRNAEAGDHEFAIAAVLALIDRASLRVGTSDYARDNKTFGATTLRSRHVSLGKGALELNYRGKGGAKVHKSLRDQTLNRVLSRLDDLPGPELMSWIDDNDNIRTVTSGEVNDFLTTYLDDGALTAKTFRTWNGSVEALSVALNSEAPTIKAMSEAAAERLSNTPAIARSSYIHPAVIALSESDAKYRAELRKAAEDQDGLRRAEAELLHLLRAEAS
ncbi:DNA topoisomerase IB [Marivita hallyeonensis]|nr:DNA topoisomerase IB [Marivita hallyeonensis]